MFSQKYKFAATPEGGPAVYMLIHCTLLLVEMAGVALDMTLRFTMCK